MGAVRTAASVTAAQQEALLWACATKALGTQEELVPTRTCRSLTAPSSLLCWLIHPSRERAVACGSTSCGTSTPARRGASKVRGLWRRRRARGGEHPAPVEASSPRERLGLYAVLSLL